MAFADLKNDYIFWRIFAKHPDLLRRLLNDLLERKDAQIIEQIEYLSDKQRPEAEGAQLSVLDARCTDRAGTTFVVKIQLIHHAGFINPFVYKVCEPYADQLKEGDCDTKRIDVVAITLCEFELWPDKKRDRKGLPRVPMLSRWNMAERVSAEHGLLQVQYVFLELPKMSARRPAAPGADLWAWLFAHTTKLTEIPPDLTPGPYADALKLANTAKFTEIELNSYERVCDEIQRTIEILEEHWVQGFAEGMREAELEGECEAKREILLRYLVRAGIALTDVEQARIDACMDGETLAGWIENVLDAKTAAEVFT